MAVVPDHVRVMPNVVGAFGDGISSVDYGCVRRCRHRRLATYLWLHGTLRGLVDETDVFISVAHLSGLVKQGLWDDAIVYLCRFLRPASQPQSDEAQVLLRFLRQHKAFASMVAGGNTNNADLKFLNHKYRTRYLKHDGSVSHDDLRIRSIVLSPQVRASLDWERVRHKASRIVYDLAFKAPELKDLALLPGGSMWPQHVLPIGFRSRPRRYVKEQGLPGPKTLTKIFLWAKKRLTSSTRSHELNTGMMPLYKHPLFEEYTLYICEGKNHCLRLLVAGLTDKTKKWLVDIIDESLQAGIMQLQSSGEKGVPGTTVSNTLTNLTRNSVPGTSSLANTGSPVAASSQTVNLTSHDETSGISAVINAGTSQLLSLENSNLRKHPRTEEIIIEQDPHPKMQRTSGA